MFTFEQTKQIQSEMMISPPESIGDFYYTSDGVLCVVGKIPKLDTTVYRQVCGDMWIFRGIDMMYVPNPIEVLGWLNKQVVGEYNVGTAFFNNNVVVTHEEVENCPEHEYAGETFEDAIFSALIKRHEVLDKES